MSKIELRALIEALEVLDGCHSRQEQLDTLELLLVAAELNPSPMPFSDLMDGIELLSETSGRIAEPWDESRNDLQAFFAGA
jgi:hypothetical protein